jgi:hypothetical protein
MFNHSRWIERSYKAKEIFYYWERELVILLSREVYAIKLYEIVFYLSDFSFEYFFDYGIS